ncbi:hypothetical protein [Saccharomonospora azurea]|uniref:hypothetical protein n=1 Tax=Saccharomonospora azurea TaxID=40988 RepID=UPI00068337C1
MVRPGSRERVEELLRTRWREPVLVLRLGEATGLGFDVPGRRPDGTVEGSRRVRQFFRNVLRGLGVAAGAVLSLASNAGSGARTSFKRQVHVTGPTGAMALEPVDAFRSARGPWLACSPSGLAIVDTGPTTADPAHAPEPRLVWEARAPQAPELRLRTRTMTWPDGSGFTFPLHDRVEEQRLRSRLGPRDTVFWNGDPEAGSRPG